MAEGITGMYEYKKIVYKFTSSTLSSKKVEESLHAMFEIIQENARNGWRFVQAVHPYSTNTVSLLIFEKGSPE